MKKLLFLFSMAMVVSLFSCHNDNSGLLITGVSGREYLKEKLDRSKHFLKYENPNGVVTYYLNTRVEKNQITMYYTTPCITDDGRYIWFWLTAGSSNFTLALFDVEKDEIYCYSGMEVHTSSSWVDTKTGDVYWVKPAENQRNTGDYYYILKRGPESRDKIKKVGRIPHFVDNCPTPRQVVTHLSPSADRKWFAFDSGHYRYNNKTYLGVVPNGIDGEARLWTILDLRYDHAQMHPVHSDVILAAQDMFTDYIGQYGAPGSRYSPTDRMWIVYADGEAKPIFPAPNYVTHEWWDATGKYVWYVDRRGKNGGKGVCRVEFDYPNRTFGPPEHIWPGAIGHACSSKSLRYLVGDFGTKTWPATNSVRVAFYNIETGKEIDIATSLPYTGAANDPHPCFAMNDAVICYTFATPEFNAVGLTFTDQLIELSK